MVKDPIFEKCPADKTPDFKECYHCEECAVLKAWKLELQKRKPSLYQRFLNKLEESFATGVVNAIMLSVAATRKKDDK